MSNHMFKLGQERMASANSVKRISFLLVRDPDDFNVDSTSLRLPEPTEMVIRVEFTDGREIDLNAYQLVHEHLNGMWNYTGPWYPGSQKPANPKKTNTPHIPTKAEEKKEEEKPKKRRNLTSWPPTPE